MNNRTFFILLAISFIILVLISIIMDFMFPLKFILAPIDFLALYIYVQFRNNGGLTFRQKKIILILIWIIFIAVLILSSVNNYIK